MKKSLQASILFLIITAFVSCGGSSGGGDGAFFGGIWRGNLNLIQHTCPWNEASTLSVVHQVNQTGTRVVLDTTGTTYEGNVIGNDGFVVGQEIVNEEIEPGLFCNLDGAIGYSNISGNRADVLALLRYRCFSGGQQGECQTRFSGVMNRD